MSEVLHKAELYFEEICTGSGITARQERQQQENQTSVAKLGTLLLVVATFQASLVT